MTQDRIGLCGPIPDNGGVAGYTASIVGRVVEKLAGLVIVVACCWWAASVERSRAADNWGICGAPVAAFPVSYAGRKALDVRPTAAHASRMDIAVHYAVGAALGMGIFPAFRRLLAEPVIQMPARGRLRVPGSSQCTQIEEGTGVMSTGGEDAGEAKLENSYIWRRRQCAGYGACTIWRGRGIL